MPCRSGEDDVPYHGNAAQSNDAALQSLYATTKAELDRVTDLLCKAGRARQNKTNLPPEVIAWWERHKCIDAQRGEPW